MIFIWFWTFLAAAIFGFAAYLQASESGAKIACAGLGIIVVCWILTIFALPDGWHEMSRKQMTQAAQQAFGGQDYLMWSAVGTIAFLGLIVLLGGLFALALRRRVTAARLGVGAFFGGFVVQNIALMSLFFGAGR